MKSIFPLIFIAALVSCATTYKMTEGDAELAIVYISGFSHPSTSIPKQGVYQPAYEIETIDEKFMLDKPRVAPSFRQEAFKIKSGKHRFGIRWWRLIEDTSYVMYGGAGIPILVGDGNWIKSKDLYVMDIDLKGGFTYVVDMESTLPHRKDAQKKLCMPEEPNEAPGHWMPPSRGFRVASKNAKLIMCSETKLQ